MNSIHKPRRDSRAILLALPIGLLPHIALAQHKLPAQGCAQDQIKRPNVILIYADDLGYGDIASNGAKGVETPNLDRLAQEGLNFHNAHAAAATSTPSRYSLLTGEYAWRRAGTDVAAGNAGSIIQTDQFTLAELFRSAGYRTGAIGKWHLGLGSKTAEQDWNGELDLALEDLGFDYSYIMAATADRVPCVFIQGRRVVNHDPSAPIYVSYDKPFEGEPTGQTHPHLLSKQRSSHGHDMAIVNGIGRIGYMKGGGKALWQDEDIADSITRHATQFIEDNATGPFFLYLATNDIHVPRYPHSRFRGKSGMGLRGDAILQLDWTVGEVLRALDEQGLRDNTLIIFSSDNGPVLDDGYEDEAEARLGEHSPTRGLRGNKYSAFEGGTRVPMLVRWPGVVPAGKASDALISQVDWFASLAQLLGRNLKAGQAMDSRGHLNTLLGQVSTEGSPYVIAQASNKTLSVRTAEWKYIEPSNGPKMIPWGPKIETGYLSKPQLYHLATDPREEHNVAELHPGIVELLSAILEAERAKQ